MTKPVKLKISSLFGDPQGRQGEELFEPGCWAIVEMDANEWGTADVMIVDKEVAKAEDVFSPEDLVVYFKEGFDIPQSRRTSFSLCWQVGTGKEDTPINEKGIAELSYGGYDDDGVTVKIVYLMFKDVTLENIQSTVSSFFAKEMKGLISEIESEAQDDREYARDPSAYYGVSNSDFISASDLKRRF